MVCIEIINAAFNLGDEKYERYVESAYRSLLAAMFIYFTCAVYTVHNVIKYTSVSHVADAASLIIGIFILFLAVRMSIVIDRSTGRTKYYSTPELSAAVRAYMHFTAALSIIAALVCFI